MSILNWLRDNYGMKTKGKDLLILFGAVLLVLALLYAAGTYL